METDEEDKEAFALVLCPLCNGDPDLIDACTCDAGYYEIAMSVVWDDGINGHLATAPDLPQLRVEAIEFDMAWNELKAMIEAEVGALCEAGEPVPVRSGD
jgi:hypothetical protein